MAVDNDGTSKPTPDPTILTTEQILREVTNAVSLIEARIDGVKGVTNERLNSVDTQFQLIERQRVEQKKDTKDAVDAALAAAKEAVKEQTLASEKSITKSETATAEQIRQLSTTFTTAINGVGVSIGDLKDRVGKIESIKAGSTERRIETTNTNTQLINALGLLIAALVFGVLVYATFH